MYIYKLQDWKWPYYQTRLSQKRTRMKFSCIRALTLQPCLQWYFLCISFSYVQKSKERNLNESQTRDLPYCLCNIMGHIIHTITYKRVAQIARRRKKKKLANTRNGQIIICSKIFLFYHLSCIWAVNSIDKKMLLYFKWKFEKMCTSILIIRLLQYQICQC